MRQWSFVSLVAAVMLTLSGIANAQQNDGERSGGLGPVKEFKEQLNSLKETLSELKRKIEGSAKSIDGITEPGKARAEIEALQSAVSGLLESVVDNSVVAGLGERALKHTRDKLSELERDTRFTADKRQGLVSAWQRYRQETEQAVQELTQARTRLVSLLRQLQTEQDYIGELMQIEQFERALMTIRDLSRAIRDASGDLERFINGLRPPGS